MVNTRNVGMSWGGLFESRPQQNCFQSFHFLLMTTYFQVYFFVYGYFFFLVRLGWE